MLWWDKNVNTPIYVPQGKTYKETVDAIYLDSFVDELDCVADEMPSAAKETLVEQRKAAGQCMKCGTLLPMTWQGLGECKGCSK